MVSLRGVVVAFFFFLVIPAQAGIYFDLCLFHLGPQAKEKTLDSGFRRNDGKKSGKARRLATCRRDT
jgi:hypothetical protein